MTPYILRGTTTTATNTTTIRSFHYIPRLTHEIYSFDGLVRLSQRVVSTIFQIIVK